MTLSYDTVKQNRTNLLRIFISMLRMLPVRQQFIHKVIREESVAESSVFSPQLNMIVASPLEVIFLVESSNYL